MAVGLVYSNIKLSMRFFFSTNWNHFTFPITGTIENLKNDYYGAFPLYVYCMDIFGVKFELFDVDNQIQARISCMHFSFVQRKKPSIYIQAKEIFFKKKKRKKSSKSSILGCKLKLMKAFKIVIKSKIHY